MIISKHKANTKNKKGYYCICECDSCGEEFTRRFSHAKRTRHQFCSAKCANNFKEGNNNPRWNGGRSHWDGYILLKRPKHPYSGKQNYVPEHRLVMEKTIGRYLRLGEVVHHINGVRDDNRIENLMLFESSSEHLTYHHKLDKAEILV